MGTYNCFIVDDEPLAIEVIETYLSNISGFKVCGTSDNAMQAIELLKQHRVDLLFLDIEMPQMSGLQLIDAMTYQTKVVLTTAYRDYAVESYNYNVLDYLLKPISYERFLKALNKFLSTTPKNTEGKIIDIKADRQIFSINIKDILYFEGAKDYVKVCTKEKNYMTYQKLGYFEKLLANDGFIRIHKSYIISLKHIIKFSSQTVNVQGTSLPVGRLFKHNLCLLK